MKVHMIWACDTDNFDEAWLVTAWDEYSIDGNDQGYQDALLKAREDHEHVRIVVVEMSWEAVMAAFKPVATTATVVDPKQDGKG